MTPHLNAPAALEPLLPSTPRADKLLEKAHDLRMEAARLSGAFPGGVHTELGRLLRSMNAYYSNKIEGEHANPLQIAQALLGRFSQEAETARLQHLAVAHMQTERWIQESSPLPADLYAAPTIRSIHSHLFSPWDHEDGGRRPPGEQGGTNQATYSPVLSHYLAGLRERDELDALLPELLRAMGHAVLSRPQIGVHQAGVDILTTHEDEHGTTEVFLFVVKFGDVGRDDFYGGKQAVDQSVREACNDFVRNRLPESLQGARKRIVLVTNGGLKQEAQSGYAALSHDIAERPLCSLEFWGLDQLTPLMEEHLFDETLLLSSGKSDLRAALAGLEEFETAVRRFVRFVDTCFKAVEGESEQAETTRKKKFLKRCATASMGWAVLLVWGQSEDNLKPGIVAGEYVLLRMWAEAVKQGFSIDQAFITRMETVLALQVGFVAQIASPPPVD